VRVPDPRRPTSLRSKLTGLLVYRVLLFVLQRASRREGDRELSRPGLWASGRTRAFRGTLLFVRETDLSPWLAPGRRGPPRPAPSDHLKPCRCAP